MVKYSYVITIDGHKNSKGEEAPWVIKDHDTNEIISSHKTKEEAENHLQDMHIYARHQCPFYKISSINDLLEKAEKENPHPIIEEMIFFIDNHIPDIDIKDETQFDIGYDDNFNNDKYRVSRALLLKLQQSIYNGVDLNKKEFKTLLDYINSIFQDKTDWVRLVSNLESLL